VLVMVVDEEEAVIGKRKRRKIKNIYYGRNQ
jgi:hypothetical protein